jgi:predicted nucleic acid-binding protein
MTIFVDTAALYAILDADDDNHELATEMWLALAHDQAALLCSNYVLVETFALVKHRLGIAAVRALQENILPVLSIQWVDESTHRAGVSALLTARRVQLSLVDCVSFELMRQFGIQTAFTFDHHFEEQGFVRIPRER